MELFGKFYIKSILFIFLCIFLRFVYKMFRKSTFYMIIVFVMETVVTVSNKMLTLVSSADIVFLPDSTKFVTI